MLAADDQPMAHSQSEPSIELNPSSSAGDIDINIDRDTPTPSTSRLRKPLRAQTAKGRATGHLPPRMSTEYKLEQLLEFLNSINWTFKDMIEAWAGGQEHQRKAVIRNHTHYAKAKQREKALKEVVDKMTKEGVIYKPQEDVLGEELDRLIQRRPFGNFEFGEDNTDSLDSKAAVASSRR
jgi:hypothetical protein